MAEAPTTAPPMEATSPRPMAWVTHVPVPLFASVMGLCGLGLLWRRAHEVLGWGGTAGAAAGEIVILAAALIYVLVGALYLLKLVRHPDAVAHEFSHPVRVNFFPAISIGLLLLAAGALPHSRALADIMWWLGVVSQLAFSLAVVSRWIVRNIEIQAASPAWFIPIVGNLAVPVAGMRLGYVDVSWFFFSIGLTFWIVLLSIVLYRIIFHNQLPPRFMPTLFILLAPPAIGFVCWMLLNGGVLDPMARILFSVSLFMALLLCVMARLFFQVPFAVSWWAYTFPSAAMGLATLRYHEAAPSTLTLALCVVIIPAATAIILIVAARTLRALVGGQLFVPE